MSKSVKFVFYWSYDEKRWVKIGTVKRDPHEWPGISDGLWSFNGDGSGFGPWELRQRNQIAKNIRQLMRKYTPERWEGKDIEILYSSQNPPKNKQLEEPK